MITAVDTALVMDTAKPHELHCAFEHLVAFEAGAPPEVILIGTCRLSDVYRLQTGKGNSEWSKIFAGGGSVLVRIIAIGDDRAELTKWAAAHMRSMPTIPRCNLHGVNLRGYSRRIRCENTGEVFPSQKEACEAYGLHASALSRHLHGHLGTAGGKMFRYVDGSK